MRIALVRHGETEWSASGRHTSFTDVELTEAGVAAARALGERLAGRDFALVESSPRTRARVTCELAGYGARAQIDDDLVEWDYGEYEGLTTPEIRESVPGWTVWTHDSPGGETAAQVGARADRVLERAAAADGDVALFAHGHFLRVLGARWIGLEPDGGAVLGLDTAALCELGFERERRVIWLWNDTSHLRRHAPDSA
ncbi:MAG TPA: histidine phosphatase family protein [Solirubrobacteraceae bacterium]|jgi:probable phosphoglycerate mutase